MTAPSQKHLDRACKVFAEVASYLVAGWELSAPLAIAREFAAVEREAIEAYELERLQAERRALGDPRDRVSTSFPEKTS